MKFLLKKRLYFKQFICSRRRTNKFVLLGCVCFVYLIYYEVEQINRVRLLVAEKYCRDITTHFLEKIQNFPENGGFEFNRPELLETSKTEAYEGVTYPTYIEFGKSGDPGEDGVGYTPLNLTGKEERKQIQGYLNYHFDEEVSKIIAVHRQLRDERLIACNYQNYTDLPKASVLIVFYNEAWSTLLRSVHSVLDRTPSHLLEEIILLDDFSNMKHLKEPLAAYLKQQDKIRLFRSQQRLGLTMARNILFQHSRGEVVIFLDSPIECFPGWIEPLLKPFRLNKMAVTVPHIESIDPSTFHLRITNPESPPVGGIDLTSLNTTALKERRPTLALPNWLNQSPTLQTLYKLSPTIYGGMYAISRDYFHYLGQYDPSMSPEGEHNTELSFKAWMCGGSISVALCSHVGHVLPQQNHTLANTTIASRNAIRVAEVWMDHYKHHFYQRIAYNLEFYGDVSDRLALRKSLCCHDFNWYLDNVYPELKDTMDVNEIYAGQIQSSLVDLCIDRRASDKDKFQKCDGNSVYQQWQFLPDGTLTSADWQLGMTRFYGKHWRLKNPPRFLYAPNKKGNLHTQWIYNDNHQLVHKFTGLCLEVELTNRTLILSECLTTTHLQTWKMTTRIEHQEKMRNERNIPIDWSV